MTDNKRNDVNRNIGLDIIRCIAILFVISCHFFLLNTSLREVPFHGISLFIQATVLSLCLTAVPLFVILTGYLNINKQCSWKYYKNIKKVLFSYILFSIITILFRKYYLNETLSWVEWGLKILDFSAIPYGWYIEMWIGLYLLTPFLNILYNNIEGQRNKQLLIIILFVTTTFPHWLNRNEMHLFPGYWQKCWPLIFYFAGAYIHEYQPKIKRNIAWVSIIGICLFNPILNLILPTPSLILFGGGLEDGCFFFIAILVFLQCYQLTIKKTILKSFIVNLSLCSLDVYLCCYIFDAFYYPIFKAEFYNSQAQFGLYFFVLVPLVLFSSFIVAWFKMFLKQ